MDDGSKRLFGATITNNHDGKTSGSYMLVFMCNVDSSTGNPTSTDTWDVMQLTTDNAEYHKESYVVGMRPVMEQDSNGDYWLHLIY